MSRVEWRVSQVYIHCLSRNGGLSSTLVMLWLGLLVVYHSVWPLHLPFIVFGIFLKKLIDIIFGPTLNFSCTSHDSRYLVIES